MNHPNPVTSATHKGLRPYQEDHLLTATILEGTLLAVFDGHGGNFVAQLASERLPEIFADEIVKEGATPRSAIESAIQRVNILTQAYDEGSTVSLAFVPSEGSKVVCAVMGDSPIIVRDAAGNHSISPDHNVRTNKAEAEAAVKRGGFIANGYLCQDWNGGGLQMARALGDAYLNRVLSRVPDIYEVEINDQSWILVGTDGLFDPAHYNFKEAAKQVIEEIEKGAEAQALVDRAVTLQTGDNVTAIVARFRKD
jgi:serine/threonine protein phosphatase PrpC